MKQISQQSRFLEKENTDPVVQTGKVIDYNPSNATCTVQLSNGGIVRGMPVLGISGSDYGTDLSFLSNLRGASVVILRADNYQYVLTTIPTQIKFDEKIAETSSMPGFGGEEKETYGVEKDKDYANSRATSFLPGDKIIQADGGGEVNVLREGISILKASPLCQFILSKFKDLGRLVTRTFQHFSDFGEVSHKHENGRVCLEIKGGAAYSEETHPSKAKWTIQAWLGDNPSNSIDRLFVKVNDANNSELVTLSFDIEGKAKIYASKDILGEADRDIEFSASEDLQLLAKNNMSLRCEGKGQYYTKDTLLIKSDKQIILKGPSRTLKL